MRVPSVARDGPQDHKRRRRRGDREGRSRGPLGDATPKRDAGTPRAVTGIPFAVRSPLMRGPSDAPPGRPPCKEARKRARENTPLPWRVLAQPQSQAPETKFQRKPKLRLCPLADQYGAPASPEGWPSLKRASLVFPVAVLRAPCTRAATVFRGVQQNKKQ